MYKRMKIYDAPFRGFRSTRFHIGGTESVVRNVVKVGQNTGRCCCTIKGINSL